MDQQIKIEIQTSSAEQSTTATHKYLPGRHPGGLRDHLEEGLHHLGLGGQLHEL